MPLVVAINIFAVFRSTYFFNSDTGAYGTAVGLVPVDIQAFGRTSFAVDDIRRKGFSKGFAGGIGPRKGKEQERKRLRCRDVSSASVTTSKSTRERVRTPNARMRDQ